MLLCDFAHARARWLKSELERRGIAAGRLAIYSVTEPADAGARGHRATPYTLRSGGVERQRWTGSQIERAPGAGDWCGQ